MKRLVVSVLIMLSMSVIAAPPTATIDVNVLIPQAQSMAAKMYPNVDVYVWDATNITRFQPISAMMEYDGKRCAIIIDTAAPASTFGDDIDVKYQSLLEQFVLFHEFAHCKQGLAATQPADEVAREMYADVDALYTMKAQHIADDSTLIAFANQILQARKIGNPSHMTGAAIQKALATRLALSGTPAQMATTIVRKLYPNMATLPATRYEEPTTLGLIYIPSDVNAALDALHQQVNPDTPIRVM